MKKSTQKTKLEINFP